MLFSVKVKKCYEWTAGSRPKFRLLCPSLNCFNYIYIYIERAFCGAVTAVSCPLYVHYMYKYVHMRTAERFVEKGLQLPGAAKIRAVRPAWVQK